MSSSSRRGPESATSTARQDPEAAIQDRPEDVHATLGSLVRLEDALAELSPAYSAISRSILTAPPDPKPRHRSQGLIIWRMSEITAAVRTIRRLSRHGLYLRNDAYTQNLENSTGGTDHDEAT